MSSNFLYEILPSVLNMSITASYVIIFVAVIRLVLKKAPKIFSYLLWIVVLVQLFCPISFESDIGLLPSNRDPIPQNIVHEEYPSVDLPFYFINRVVNENLPYGEEQLSAEPLESPVAIMTLCWGLGIVAMIIYSIVSLRKLNSKLVGATLLRDNIYIVDHIDSPFVMGIVKARIYLPSSLSDVEQEYIIKHEQCHIKRFDHITRILAFIALSVHWFNPLVWLAFTLSAKDMELSCDEAVMKKMDCDIRAEYCNSLLKFATGKKMSVATVLTFGEGNTKERVKNVMKYKKPVIWISCIVLIFVVVISIALLSSQSSTISIFEADGSYFPRSELKNIEGITIRYNLNSYTVNEDEISDVIAFLKEIELESEELTSSRSEGRDKTNQINLYSEETLINTLNFGSDFSEFWMDNKTKPSLSYVVKTPMTEMLKFFSSSSEIKGIDILHKYRTKYVGDNSSTANLCMNLPLPNDARYEGISINSDTNTLTVCLKGDAEKYHNSIEESKIFSQNAVLLFSLIENLHLVTFDINPEDSRYGGIIYTRENAEKEYGELFPQTESVEDLALLVGKVFTSQDVTNITKFNDIPADFGNLNIDKIEVVASSEDSAYYNEHKTITDIKEISNFVKIFENAKINESIAIDIAIAEPSYYRFYDGANLIKQYQFNGNDVSAIWTDSGYSLIEYKDETPYEAYKKSTADMVLYNKDTTSTKAINIAKEYVKDDKDSRIIDYDKPRLENVILSASDKIFDLDRKELIEAGDRDAYAIIFNTEQDDLIGPIIFYVDAKTMEPLGFAPRR